MALRALLVLLPLLSCGGAVPTFDSGVLPIDDVMDGGSSTADAGAGVDAGQTADAGRPDAGMVDAGNPQAAIDAIKTLAIGSACYRYNWLNRGRMPPGYIKGVSLSFARAVCQLPTRTDLAIVSKAVTTDMVHDAIAWYGPQFQALNMDNSVAGVVTMRHVYTLLIGLGMRESSGEHCVGRDMSATNVTSDSSEAGAWQTSWDSRSFSMELPKLFNFYKTNTAGCFSTTYAEGVTCSAADWQNWGTGADGLLFQQMEKECPGFAADYAAVMLRVSGGSVGHYGPLRRHEAEVKAECDALLQSVQGVVAAQPEICTVF